MIEGESFYQRLSGWTLYPAVKKSKVLLIALHGFRQNREDSINFWGELKNHCHFLAVDGPLVHEYGQPRQFGQAWYVYDGDRNKFKNELACTSLFLNEVIKNVSSHIEFEEIYLTGFSQGAYMALYYGLQNNNQVTFIQAIGGNLHKSMMPNDLTKKCVWIHYGSEDPFIKEEKMDDLNRELIHRGAQVEQRKFNATHAVIPEMINELTKKLQFIPS